MQLLSNGDAASVVPFTTGRDEIADMARAVEVFRHNAVERGRLEAQQVSNGAAENSEAVATC